MFWALVSTKHLQASYLRDFRTENDMLRGNTFFPIFSPKSKLTRVQPYFKRVVFGRFKIFRALVSTKHLQGSYLRDFRTEKDMLRGNTFFSVFSPKSKRTPVRPYFKRVVFGRFWISRALVSTKHLQASYLMDFSTENGMLRGNTFFSVFSPKSKRTPVRPYFKRVVFGRFWISRALVSTKHLQASYLIDFSTENGMLRGSTFFPFFFT